MQDQRLRGQQLREVITDYINQDILHVPAQPPVDATTFLLQTDILDSLALLKLLGFIEQQFGIEVTEFERLSEIFGSVDSICQYIVTAQPRHAEQPQTRSS